MSNYRQVVILNSDNYTRYQFAVDDKSLARLKSCVERLKNVIAVAADSMPGIDSAATMGFRFIFECIPLKFPIQDLFNFIRQEIDPDVPTYILEQSLIFFAQSMLAEQVNENG